MRVNEAGGKYVKEQLADVLSSQPGGGKLLDIGCGTGLMLTQLAPVVATLVGIDPAEGMLAEAKIAAEQGGFKDRCRLYNVLVEDVPAEEVAAGKFTLVTCTVVAHHMPDPTATFAKVRLCDV